MAPKEILISEIGKCLALVEEAGLVDYLAANPEAVLSNTGPTLWRPFGVSNRVIELRVEREGLWPPNLRYVNGEGV